METTITYIASQILPGDTERIRRHTFTRWMSQDLAQATVDFCKNIGLVSIYSETSPENRVRFILWKPPEEGRVEIRPGHPEKKFREMDQVNIKRGWPLLALHINEKNFIQPYGFLRITTTRQ